MSEKRFRQPYRALVPDAFTLEALLLWLHYADTLRHWQRRFAANRHTIASPYRHLLPVVSIAAEVVCDDLSDPPGLGIVCQFLAHLRRREVIGQAKQVHWHSVPHSEKPSYKSVMKREKFRSTAIWTSGLGGPGGNRTRVLSSTLRYDPAGVFSAKHWGIPFMDLTPDLPKRPRRDEILA
jgi:hypothetical protein